MIDKSSATSADRHSSNLHPTKAAWILYIASLTLIIALLALPFLLKLDGKSHADWEQFLGRFHPLAVHLPIGLLVLIPLLEISAIFRPALREAAGFVLGLAFVSCLCSLTLGYFLAYGSGNSGTTVTRHMWGGIALSIGVLMCLLARPLWSSTNLPRTNLTVAAYPILLIFVMAALTWTAHQGGSLTHGSNYLTQYMPQSLKHSFTAASTSSATQTSDSFYARYIHPTLDANCVACHGEAKAMAGLRLDSYELLMKGGKDAPAIVPGHPEKSLLIERVSLPPSHKQFMPAEGRPPLKPEEINWIKAWIEQGASPTATKLAGISFRENTKELPPKPVGDYSGMIAELRKMEAGQGAKLQQVSSKPSDGLILNTVDIAANFGDAQLAQLQKFAPFIVEAELGRTAITDASFETLSKFSHLRALHLEGTSVTGNGLAKLTSLSELSYLNLSGTKVTVTSVASLDAMKNLRHVYLYNTPAQPAPAADALQPIAKKAE